jgi:hypothetical protein
VDELAQLTGLCSKLGASPAQADAMARQLMKRADQLMVQRSLTRDQAMAYLLRLTVQGRSGEVPKEFQPPTTPGAD